MYSNDHSVPCVSFGFSEEKKQIKAEYQIYITESRGRELGALRKQGVVIEDITYVPRFVYVGDTSERVFEMNPELFKYQDIIVECTFLEDDDLEQATKTKHCHWYTHRTYTTVHVPLPAFGQTCFVTLYDRKSTL